MTTPNPSESEIRRILSNARTVAVVGISDKPDRPSHEVAEYLQAAGYRIVPVNPQLEGKNILGETCVGSLEAIEGEIDLVDVFRRAEAVPEVIESALRTRAPVIWLQLGIVNEEAASRAREAGRTVVQDRCTKIDHARLVR